MKYCYECGTRLIERELKDEGLIPYCPSCNEYRFPIYSAAISVVILNKDKTKGLLIKQYGKSNYRLVAGYINKGESAEEALIREMKEEIGVAPIFYRLNATRYFERTNTLMINFYAILDSEDINSNYEIDSYSWIDINDCVEALNEAKLACEFFKIYLNNN